VLEDVAALAPPLIMCVAFLLGVGWFLRRQMAPRGRRGTEQPGADSRTGDSSASKVASQAGGSSPGGDHHEDG
jgi:hypothetical protein